MSFLQDIKQHLRNSREYVVDTVATIREKRAPKTQTLVRVGSEKAHTAREYITTIWTSRRWKKIPRRIRVTAFVVIFVGIVVTFFFYSLAQRLYLLSVSFDEISRKIPFNASYVEFTFSQKISPTSATTAAVRTEPYIDGNISLEGSGSTVRYTFIDPLPLGQKFTFTIDTTLESENGRNVDKQYVYTLEIVSAAKAVTVTPVGSLHNLYQNVTVLFNMPMVALTNLDKRDTYECPLRIEPAITGKCIWTTPQILEFIPEEHFHGATDYTLTVQDAT